MVPDPGLAEAPQRVTIYEVGPRDGLQNEKQPIATADKLTFVHALADAVQAGEGREQGGVEVDDPPSKRLEQRGLHHAHEARQDDQVDALFGQCPGPEGFLLG